MIVYFKYHRSYNIELLEIGETLVHFSCPI